MKRERARIVVRGAVQGVGFRPFAYRLATDLGLDGWILNSSQGVFLEVEGEGEILRQFVTRLEKQRPSRAVIQSFETSWLDAVGYTRFEIRESDESGAKTALILPDIATCADCAREILDCADRRFRYPFTNCTNCGPRFSIIEALPYDRARTSMKRFAMCADCDREYHDPLDRRFHAQPNACPVCGPQLQFWNGAGEILAEREAALDEAVAAIRSGQILALKGLGGFQLIVDATNQRSVEQLRQRKNRAEKPFAVMVPSLEIAREFCRISDLEERLLLSPEAPIVLLRRRDDAGLASAVAPGNPYLGIMLPYTPLHHLLLHSLGKAIVATSGNLSDEPICIDEHEALERLAALADVFLVHDRPIVRHVDDSIARIMAGRELILRRARGYAPLPITLKPAEGARSSGAVLALGAHLKNTVALRVGANAFVSQHLGDLATEQAYAAFVKSAGDLPRLYEAPPEMVACDLHPDYLSTKFASGLGLPVQPVQHHWAHIAACMAENELAPPVLGVSWDGTGYGDDGTIWGGEFFAIDRDCVRRVAHLRQFALPGGEAAVKEPRRCALGLLHEILGEQVWERADLLRAFSPRELGPIRTMLERKLNSPRTSSAGRLFDAMASLLGARDRTNFEGQAAMELEFAAKSGVEEAYPVTLNGAEPEIVDWEPGVLAALRDLGSGEDRGVIAAKFHNMLVEAVVMVAQRVGEPRLVLSGGCFQNATLTERAITRLTSEGFRPYWHQRIPPNDGGISLGQLYAVSLFPPSS